ncbi:putative germin-like protein subfamily 1 member 12 [Arabidopsis thaliana]
MNMKNLYLAILYLLAASTLPFAIASDPSPLQDFCIGVNTPANALFVNGKFCKDPKLVTADDFYFTGLTRQELLNLITGLNTLGISLVRIDYGINGQNPPHTHPRATEILLVQEGTLFVGFFSSFPENRLLNKTLNKGDVFVFPEGLIHFQVNIGKQPAVAFASLSSQNPGVIIICNTLFGSKPPIDPNILAKSFQLDPKVIIDLQKKFG